MSDLKQTVWVSAGAKEFTWRLTITETAGRDVTLGVVHLSLGDDSGPGSWVVPDIDSQVGSNARMVQMLVDGDTDTGVYWLWSRMVLDSETVVRRHHQIALL